MAKALLGHVGGPNHRMAAELHRLRRRICDLEGRWPGWKKNMPHRARPMMPVTLGQILPDYRVAGHHHQD